jgi:hypothetical protein
MYKAIDAVFIIPQLSFLIKHILFLYKHWDQTQVIITLFYSLLPTIYNIF